MSIHFVTDSIWVDEEKSVVVLSNATWGDGRTFLLRNNFPGGTNEPIYYLRTVTDSLLVCHDNLPEVANMFGVETDFLAELVPENHRYHPDKADEE